MKDLMMNLGIESVRQAVMVLVLVLVVFKKKKNA